MKTRLKSCVVPMLIGSILLNNCGGTSDTSTPQASANMAQQVRPVQKTSALDNSYEPAVQQLYVSYFGRPADPAGLANFEAALAAANAPPDIQSLVLAYNSNAAVKKLIDSFGTSNESQALYNSSTTEEFVTAIFKNVLNRAPADAGMTFWVNAINSGQTTRGDAALSIMAGALVNTTAQGLIDAQLVDNRIAVATTFTEDLNTEPEILGYSGAAAAQVARSFLAGVTDTTNLSSLAVSINALAQSFAKYAIGGTLAGLGSGASITLLDNGGDALTLTADGSFQFATALLPGASYDVTISTLPVGESCAVASGSAPTVVGDVVNVDVTCHYPYAYALNLGADSISQYDLLGNGNLSVISPATVSTGKSPSSITIDPAHQNVYVTNETDGTVSRFTVGSGGALTAGGTVAAQYEPSAVAITPNDKYAYVTNSGTTTVSQYTVLQNGSLSPQANATVSAGTSPIGIAIDPTSSFVYVVNNVSNTVSQYTIGAGGGLTPMSVPTVSTGSSPLSVTMSLDGKYVYVVNSGAGDNSVSQYSVSANGSLVALSPAKVAVGATPASLAIDPGVKNVYVVDTAGVVLQYSIGSGGALSQVSSVSVAQASAVAVDPSGRFAYVTSKAGTVAQFTIGSGGGLSAMSPASVAAGATPYGILVTY